MSASATSNLSPAPSPSSPRQTNWAFVVRVGLISAIIAGLVGYAAYSTYRMMTKSALSGDEVDLLMISSFEMSQQFGTIADVPPAFRALSGKKVKMEGELTPTSFQTIGATGEFDICYSVQKCCYSAEPKAQHFVKCRPAPGVKLKVPVDGRVRVYGTLTVNVIREGGKVQSVYQMEIERVDPA
ncbi:MAG: hypothetical protein ACAI43_01545 [Phycisphaerae bacterium]